MEIYFIVFLTGFAIGILIRGEQHTSAVGPWGGETRRNSGIVLYIVFVLLAIVAVFLAKDLLH